MLQFSIMGPAMRRLSRFLCAALLFWQGTAAQGGGLTIEIVGGASTRVVIAVGPFGDLPKTPDDPAQIVRDDLARSGLFKVLPVEGLAPGEAQVPAWGRLRSQGVDAVLLGQMTRLADGRIEVRFRLHDAVRVRQLIGFSYTVPATQLRQVGHKIADEVHQALLGEPGAYGGRIAYVVKQGVRYALKVSDVDGYNAFDVIDSSEPIISPAWSPDGKRLAYVSFEERKPVVYVQDLANGRRHVAARFKGSNSAPAWAPDGRSLAVTLSRDRSSQIYLISPDGQGEPRRLMASASLDTEPSFSPDGKFIYFTSDRGGSPQIYRFEPASGEVQRITFEGQYNVSPAPSPDGKLLAFVHRLEGAFRIAVLDMETRQMQILSDTDADESPSFAPNSRMILYATRVNGKGVLATVSADGRIKQRLTQQGNLREPTWAP